MPVNHSSNTIKAHKVSFSFGSQIVLEDVDFEVERGTYLGVIGPNGAGKTTLAKIILGLLRPTSGSVSIFGESVEEARRHGHIGYVPQRAGQVDRLFPATVKEVVRSGRFAKARLFHRLSADDDRAVDNVMVIAGVAELKNRPIGALSGGERQKVFIARALAGDPDILVLDEPSAGVDVSSQEQFFQLLKELHEKSSLTTVLISHDVETVVQEANSVLCINRALICHVSAKDFIQEGIPERLYGRRLRFLGHDHPH